MRGVSRVCGCESVGYAKLNNPNETNLGGCVRNGMKRHGGRLNEVCLQDTGAAVTNAAAKAKDMTAEPEARGRALLASVFTVLGYSNLQWPAGRVLAWTFAARHEEHHNNLLKWAQLIR